MKTEKLRAVFLPVALIISLFLSCYIQLSYASSLIPGYNEMITKFSNYMDNFEWLILIIAFIFQLFIMLGTILLETLLIYLIISFFYKKKCRIKECGRPVMLSTLVVLIINMIITTVFLPKNSDI